MSLIKEEASGGNKFYILGVRKMKIDEEELSVKRSKLRAFLWCISFIFVLMLNCTAFAASFGAVESIGTRAEKINQNSREQDDGTYTQEFLSEESGLGCYLSGPDIDWYWNYYFMKRNVAGTESYLFKNYSPINKNVPFITVAGKVDNWSVTPDEGESYFYYKLEGKDGMYRLQLEQGATRAEYKEFEFEGSPFLFESFTLADDPDKFFLMSSHDKNLKVTIGLFSFEGNTTPSATWTCTLPQEWKNNYKPVIRDQLGYGVYFEASTSNLWLIAQRSNWNSAGSLYNFPYWFFNKKISAPGELTEFKPASEISNWNNNSNFKYLMLGRYFSLIIENSGSSVFDDILNVRVYDPVEMEIESEALTQWVNGAGATRPIGEFPTIQDTSSFTLAYNYTVDSNRNIYMKISKAPLNTSGWDATFQRFARFKPLKQMEQPEPDPSVTNAEFPDPNNVVLKTSEFKGPSGYKVVSSRWRIYMKASGASRAASSLIHEETQTGAGNTYKIPGNILASGGEYEWQMSYDWEYSSVHETMKGATSWSDPATFTVKGTPDPSPIPDPGPDPTPDPDPSPNPDPGDNGGGSSGGCNAGAFGMSLLLMSGVALIVKKRN